MIVQELSHSHRLSPTLSQRGEQPHRSAGPSILDAYQNEAHSKRKRDPTDPMSTSASGRQPLLKRTADARQLVARDVSNDSSEEREDSPADAGHGAPPPSSSADGLLQQRDDDECLSLVHNYRRSLLCRQDTHRSSNRSSFFGLPGSDDEEEEERRASPIRFHCIQRATTICEDSDDCSKDDDPPEVRSRASSPQEPTEGEQHVFPSSLISPYSAYSRRSSSRSPISSMWQEDREVEDAEERERPEWLSVPSSSTFQTFRLPSRRVAWNANNCFRPITFTGFHRGSS